MMPLYEALALSSRTSFFTHMNMNNKLGLALLLLDGCIPHTALIHPIGSKAVHMWAGYRFLLESCNSVHLSLVRPGRLSVHTMVLLRNRISWDIVRYYNQEIYLDRLIPERDHPRLNPGRKLLPRVPHICALKRLLGIFHLARYHDYRLPSLCIKVAARRVTWCAPWSPLLIHIWRSRRHEDKSLGGNGGFVTWVFDIQTMVIGSLSFIYSLLNQARLLHQKELCFTLVKCQSFLPKSSTKCSKPSMQLWSKW